MGAAWDAVNLLNGFRLLKASRLIREGLTDRSKFRSVEYRARLLDVLLSLSEVQNMFTGYKTYIVAALMGTVTVLHALGYIDAELRNMLMQLLGAGAIGTVASKLNRLVAK